MRSFLKKIGTIMLDVTAMVTGFAPIIESVDSAHAGVVKVVSTDLTAIANAITQVESAAAAVNAAGGSITGAQKLQMLIPAIRQIVITSNVVANRQIASPDLLEKAVAEFAQAGVDMLNAIHPDEAQHMVVGKVKT